MGNETNSMNEFQFLSDSVSILVFAIMFVLRKLTYSRPKPQHSTETFSFQYSDYAPKFHNEALLITSFGFFFKMDRNRNRNQLSRERSIFLLKSWFSRYGFPVSDNQTRFTSVKFKSIGSIGVVEKFSVPYHLNKNGSTQY